MRIRLDGVISPTQIKDALKGLANSETAEVLVTTWAIEFLRLRRYGKFNFGHMVGISVLMLIIRLIIEEAGRRSNGNHREVVLHGRRSQMESMGNRRNSTRHDWDWLRRGGPKH
jgi:hypothetical protein